MATCERVAVADRAQITEGLASEYGHSGIRVNAICPILAYTDL